MATENSIAVKVTERVEIIALEGAKYMIPGKSYFVHPEQAKRFIALKKAEYAKKKTDK